ncbi:MAG: substrate-binding domain-containing protein [Kiritimatiellae bacterium]|nr:substrate-binding domain-containing protein [Kiritimatiellia bacterium]
MTNKTEDTKRILVALDLTHQSGREHLSGFYSLADKKSNWEMRLVPSTEPSYLAIVEQFLSEGVDGAIVKGECVLPLAKAIRKAGIPVVAIDRPHSQKEDVADVYVCNDNALIGRSAAQFFDTLGRFASYGFVPDPNNCEWSRTRGKAFLGACAAKHRSAKTSSAKGDLTEWLAALPKPAAVFTAFDPCAANVLEACRKAKLKVPKDVAVLGVDDDALICEHTRPKLSSVKPDSTGQGFAAAQALSRALHARGVSKKRSRTIVCPRLRIVERDSTATVPPAAQLVRNIIAYLDEHALEPIRVSDVVEHAGVSSRLANLRFSQTRGHSIQEDIVERRLKEAKRLLSATDWSMKRIAERCGFKSQIVLAHLFSSRFGKSMRQWRIDTRTGPA